MAEEHASHNSQHRHPRIPLVTRLVATGLFTGYIPWASGTCGSLLGALVWYFIPGFEQPLLLTAIVLFTFFIGVQTSAKVAQIEGHRLAATAALAKQTFQPGVHESPDPSIVVIDEVVGMWISLLLFPKSFVALVIAFLLFRAFDIVKPFPAQHVERISRGWGIMLDDVVAGIYANVSTWVVLLGIHALFPNIP